jgi:hypothetical protein
MKRENEAIATFGTAGPAQPGGAEKNRGSVSGIKEASWFSPRHRLYELNTSGTFRQVNGS